LHQVDFPGRDIARREGWAFVPKAAQRAIGHSMSAHHECSSHAWRLCGRI